MYASIKRFIIPCIIVLICMTIIGCRNRVNISPAYKTIPGAANSTIHKLINLAASPLWLADKDQPEPGKIQVEPPGGKLTEVAEYQGIPGWARTWGGTNPDAVDSGQAVAVDISGNVYVTGYFSGKATFNTNPGQKLMLIESQGSSDVFLSKFDSKGNFLWVRTWGGALGDIGEGVAVGQAGNVYVAGSFQGNVDFNPDKDKHDWHQSNGASDVFLTRFDKDGNYYWTRTWGGGRPDEGKGVAAKGLNQICVVGYFQNDIPTEPVDFDPGPGYDRHKSKGGDDSFLTMFDFEGNHLGVRVWGGEADDYCQSVALDKNGNAYVCGSFFSDNLDFSCGLDPGSCTKSPNGGCDIYLSKFNKLGDHKWTHTWGMQGYDTGKYTAVDPVTGDVYVTGTFWLTVDFSAGQDNPPCMKTAVDKTDVYLSKFNPHGDFQWAYTFGGMDQDSGIGVAVTRDEKVYVTGYYIADIAFTPGAASRYSFTCAGETDGFLCKFNKHGGIELARTFGHSGRDRGMALATDPINGAYVTGWFGGQVNFATTGYDYHTAKGATDVFLCSYPADGNWGVKLEMIPGVLPKKLEEYKKK